MISRGNSQQIDEIIDDLHEQKLMLVQYDHDSVWKMTYELENLLQKKQRDQELDQELDQKYNSKICYYIELFKDMIKKNNFSYYNILDDSFIPYLAEYFDIKSEDSNYIFLKIEDINFTIILNRLVIYHQIDETDIEKLLEYDDEEEKNNIDIELEKRKLISEFTKIKSLEISDDTIRHINSQYQDIDEPKIDFNEYLSQILPIILSHQFDKNVEKTRTSKKEMIQYDAIEMRKLIKPKILSGGYTEYINNKMKYMKLNNKIKYLK
jgi:hypothetical protein